MYRSRIYGVTTHIFSGRGNRRAMSATPRKKKLFQIGAVSAFAFVSFSWILTSCTGDIFSTQHRRSSKSSKLQNFKLAVAPIPLSLPYNPAYLPLRSAGTEISIVDFDGDGWADFAEQEPSIGQLNVYRNRVASFDTVAFVTLNPPFMPHGNPNWEVLFADINGDGLADMIHRDKSNGEMYFYYQKNSNFQTPADLHISAYDGVNPCTSPPDTSSWRTYFADVNGDGKADFILFNTATGDIGVHLNNGAGFSAWDDLTQKGVGVSQTTSPNFRTYFADFNGDGKVDVANVDFTKMMVFVHLNEGGKWSQFDSFSFKGPNASYDTEYQFADVNGDGKAEMISHDLNKGEILAFEILETGFPEKELAAFPLLMGRGGARANPARNIPLPQFPYFRTKDSVIFYVMDYLPGVNQAQVNHNGPSGFDKNGWWPLNPNFLTREKVNCDISPGVVVCDPPGSVPWSPWDKADRYRTNTPMLGLYDSADPAVIKQHAYWMRALGHNVVAIDWTNHTDPTAESVYDTAQARALESLLSTYASITEFTPPKILIVMRQFHRMSFHWNADEANNAANRTAGEIWEFYSRFPGLWYSLDDGGPDAAKPVLYIFTDQQNLTVPPDQNWHPTCVGCQFNLRWGNGMLSDVEGLTEAFPDHPMPYAKRVKNNLPYWSHGELKIELNERVTVYTSNRYGRSQPEFGTTHVASSLSNGWIRDPTKDVPYFGMFDSSDFGPAYIHRGSAPFSRIPPQVTMFGVFNYPLGWYLYPGEGQSLNNSYNIEPSYPLPRNGLYPTQNDAGPYPDLATIEAGDAIVQAEESSFFIFDETSKVSHTMEALISRPPGRPVVLTCTENSLTFSSNNYPTRYRVSNESGVGAWKKVDVTNVSATMGANGGLRRGFAITLGPEISLSSPIFIQTKNAFGSSEIGSTICKSQ